MTLKQCQLSVRLCFGSRRIDANDVFHEGRFVLIPGIQRLEDAELRATDIEHPLFAALPDSPKADVVDSEVWCSNAVVEVAHPEHSSLECGVLDLST